MKSPAYPIDKSLPTPAYLQLKEKLANAIADGSLVAGSALPSERELAENLGLSRMTVRRAFEELVADKLVEQRQGSGTYVKPRRVKQMIDRVLGFSDEALSLGFKAGSQLLEFKLVNADEATAHALNISEGTRVLSITRLRTADHDPLAIQIAHLAPEYSELAREVLIKHHSLYKSLAQEYNVQPSGAKQTVSARLPSRQESQLLKITLTTPVLALERITFDGHQRPFEYARSAYRSDKYQMIVDLQGP